MEGEDKRAQKEALFGDLAAKLASGPPKKPVGLVKKQEQTIDTMKEEDKAPAPTDEQKAAMSDMAKMMAGDKTKR
ncbi:hypothetical protein NDN08_001341 [Rhodosorus marinus]|uniref:Uncharacterized protein n=1 Tax=Rhodosorus marinus TaxID=101924 RepID=A0AAV8UUN7_9RHOD|nr:hypothetical protein NDN08_001341 [Rhodosorus marinus]